MIIRDIVPVSTHVNKIVTTDSQIFYIHSEFFDGTLTKGEITTETQNAIIDSALCFACLMKATNLLSRAEHTRFLLTQKLQKRDFSLDCINKVLDYLENKGTLSDGRFAQCFLLTRKNEGRAKLMLELQKRGVKKDIAQDALDEYFFNNNENDLCKAAAKKLLKQNNAQEQKVIAALMRKGFSYKVIKNTLSECRP